MKKMNEPVKLKIYPIYGEYCGNSRVIVGSRESCGKCGASVPRNVKYCPDCGVPIYGRAGKGSYSICGSCGGLIPNGEGRDKCPNCRAPFTEE